MVVQIKILDRHPTRPSQRVARATHPHSKAVVGEETFLDRFLQLLKVQPVLEQKEGCDHHEIVGPVHVQPGRIGFRKDALSRPGVFAHDKRLDVQIVFDGLVKDRGGERSHRLSLLLLQLVHELGPALLSS